MRNVPESVEFPRKNVDMPENLKPTPNAAQIEHWNAVAGRVWAQYQELLDRQIEALGLAAIDALKPAKGEHVLDIGCGCGQSTLALAERVGSTGSVIGVDISVPMLEVALRRARAKPSLAVTFRQVDAQTDELGRGQFEAAFSRFGVMFFSDPEAAFTNIRKSLKAGGRLAFICWRCLAENPWMQAPLQAALPFLPPIAPLDPTAPGPFSFAAPERVRGILANAGFRSVAINALDAPLGGADVEQTLNLSLNMGPLGAALRQHPELKAVVADAVRDMLSVHLTPNGVVMPAAVWIVTGQSGSAAM
ncbi:MAG: SAM-dependent methyltransferase [Proteobacteria bacterium]|nr:MAG: SAM-dependent methyltransferase [Pseudomonadota bacterium]